MRFVSIFITSVLLTGCLSVGRSDGARTLAPGKFELAVQAGFQSEDFQQSSSKKSCGGEIPCEPEDPEKVRRDAFAFSNGILTLQGQGRLGIVDSFDAGLLVSLTGIGIDFKRNWLDTETFAVATSITGMTTGSSASQSLGDSRMSSVHLSLPLEANVQLADNNAKGVTIVAPLFGYYWKGFKSSSKPREDSVTGVEAMVGMDLKHDCQCILRFGIHGWYVHPRTIGAPTSGAAVGVAVRTL